jgi:septum formation protein
MSGSPTPLVLASQSPRRVELMRDAGYVFETLPVDVEESHDPALTPGKLTIENATLKAVAGARLRPGAIVIGADTLVYLDGAPLGKPRDMAHAISMLKQLGGKAHHVCTGVALAQNGGATVRPFAVISHVVFKPLTDALIRDYYAKVNPLDKAGAYAIQEHGDMIIDHTEGSWSNIVGLPMERLREELAALGVFPSPP